MHGLNFAPHVTLRFEYDPALPITHHRDEILAAVERHSVVIVCGATGSGKTTQLPKMCLEAGRGAKGRLVGHTQPRRLAARALAERVASELGVNLGSEVGFQVRFTDRTGPSTRLKLMTDGILLKELESDRRLRRYDTLIIDEAHERSLNIDLLFGVVRGLVESRADLKVIITSATIDSERFSQYFGGAPVIEVSGRSYPVEVRYRPLLGDDDDGELSLPEGIVAAVRELESASRGIRGDTLVFLPGEKQIREAADALEKSGIATNRILALYARLSASDQQRIFARHDERRIVLATNVAETSLTVPGIRFVVDSGLARISRYSVRGKVQRLPIERVSQASAEQRKGRCGREAEGICIRLFSEEDFETRAAFTEPEVLRTNLASVILRMATIGLGDPQSFPFLDPPDTRLIGDGVRLLQELQAMDEERSVTPLGARIATLPVDPRLGRMLLEAHRRRCLAEMLVVASFLEAQDPRERPAEYQQASSEKHAAFADARSDFTTVLNLWRLFHEQAATLSKSALRRWCREQFLSYIRLREWQDLHAQLTRAIVELDLRPNEVPATFAELHQAILSGFLGSIGQLDERREYLGPRGNRFVIAPGTPLASRPPKWIVAGSLMETARLYARMVAAIDPAWIEAAAQHLVKRAYSEPHWVRERGAVLAYETVTLYGLTLASQRRVNYGSVVPREAQQIFIREALVVGNSDVRGEFLDANRTTMARAALVEDKLRRRDVLLDESAFVEFYAARIPERIHSVATFESWRSKAERAQPKVLYMTDADVRRADAPQADLTEYPDTLEVDGNALPLRYRFDSTQRDDGITLEVPELLVDRLHPERLAWLVPGREVDKVSAILRALPKAQRKAFVPVPEYARRALSDLRSTLATARDTATRPAFHDWLAEVVSRELGQTVTATQIASLPVPDKLRFNVRVIDAHGRPITESRDWASLRRAQTPAREIAGPGTVMREWDGDDLPETAEIVRNGLRLKTFPALQEREAGVARFDASSADEASTATREALTRLAWIALPQQVKQISKRVTDDRDLLLSAAGMDIDPPLARAIAWRSFRETLFPADVPLPRARSTYLERVDAERANVADAADRITESVRRILLAWRAVRTALNAARSRMPPNVVADIEAQLAALLGKQWVVSTPQRWFEHLARFLKALQRRIERFVAATKRDAEAMAQVQSIAKRIERLRADTPRSRWPLDLHDAPWWVEELRVSLFAQELRTSLPVSERRINEQLDRVEQLLRRA